MVERAVPILPSRDLPETLAFYGRLGFTNLGAPPEEWDYLILGRGGVVLHFIADPDVDPTATAGSCFVYVEDADGVHGQWRDAGVGSEADPVGVRLEPPKDTAYGMREFALVDPSGNLVRVGSELPAHGRGEDAQEVFTRLTEALLQHKGVTAPEPGAPRRFGSAALKVDGSIFAMLQDGHLVVKLPRHRVAQLIAEGVGAPFGVGRGRGPMAEWVQVRAGDEHLWSSLAREAWEFVAEAPHRG